MKSLTPGTPTTADLDHILSNGEKEHTPIPVICEISDNTATKKAYLTNSLGARQLHFQRLSCNVSKDHTELLLN